ncbi:MAG: ABC transporter ATP-binding protein [Gammaproteobacteria bacterium]|nr:ABC transporter ATP-binding protein [Gammaproteobacteria bacterium]
MSILQLSSVSKAYIEFPNFRHRFLSWFGRQNSRLKKHLILDNINLSVEQGEAIAFVGQNGAGKSTLLKLITGILAPSTGNIQVNGKISAILELGMGFDANFSGAENAKNTLSIMGYHPEQIEQAIPEIKAFSEIGDYFEQPMRIYSSGMQMRVAFAVATTFQPEILIIDEALSVGDAYFQHKSFDRIRELQKQGTTLLIVSHDKQAIQSICNRAILLDQGRIKKEGSPIEVMDYYNALIAAKSHEDIVLKPTEEGKLQTLSGNHKAQITEVKLYNSQGIETQDLQIGELATLNIQVEVLQPMKHLVCGFMLKERLGQVIYGTNTWFTEQVLTDVTEPQRINYQIQFAARLGVGSYSCTLALTGGATHLQENYHWIDLALVFKVLNINKTEFIGTNWLEPEFIIQRD